MRIVESTKKTLGVIGALVIYFISIFAIVKDSNLVEVILIMDIGFVCALFGIKAYTGIKAKTIDRISMERNTNHQEENDER